MGKVGPGRLLLILNRVEWGSEGHSAKCTGTLTADGSWPSLPSSAAHTRRTGVVGSEMELHTSVKRTLA